MCFAVCCSSLHCVAGMAVCCNVFEFPAIVKVVREKVMCVLRCVAVCCSDCSLLQYV